LWVVGSRGFKAILDAALGCCLICSMKLIAFLLVLFVSNLKSEVIHLPHRVLVLKNQKDKAVLSSLRKIYGEYTKSIFHIQSKLINTQSIEEAKLVQNELQLSMACSKLLHKTYQFIFDPLGDLPEQVGLLRKTRNEQIRKSLQVILKSYISELKKAQAFFITSDDLNSLDNCTAEIKRALSELDRVSGTDTHMHASGNSGFFRGHYYRYYPQKYKWHEAKKECELLRGHLVVITSKEENDFVRRLFKTSEEVWLGASDEKKEGNWNWVNGEKWVFADWGSWALKNKLHKKGGDFLVFTKSKTWYPHGAHSPRGFICEWD